mmetsp:Transcript_10912/g.20811  ORF Transcript_10912/g.20811 Transcript_10912/m.20811 type:complete len:211 (-) Transcript_10912:1323-1955(-)
MHLSKLSRVQTKFVDICVQYNHISSDIKPVPSFLLPRNELQRRYLGRDEGHALVLDVLHRRHLLRRPNLVVQHELRDHAQNLVRRDPRPGTPSRARPERIAIQRVIDRGRLRTLSRLDLLGRPTLRTELLRVGAHVPCVVSYVVEGEDRSYGKGRPVDLHLPVTGRLDGRLGEGGCETVRFAQYGVQVGSVGPLQYLGRDAIIAVRGHGG